jgi:transcriptional regulator with XRE-family HTH domain
MNPSRAHDPDSIRLARIKAGLNLLTVADRAGISKSHLSNVERGITGVSPETLASIAKAIGCEMAEFFLSPEATASAEDAA